MRKKTKRNHQLKNLSLTGLVTAQVKITSFIRSIRKLFQLNAIIVRCAVYSYHAMALSLLLRNELFQD